MAAPAMSDSETISIVSPAMNIRRPSLQQVLQLTGGSQLLLSNTEGNLRITIPKDVWSDIVNDEESEHANKRKQLYQGENDLTIFDPAEQQKNATEIMMKQFVSEMKSQSRPRTNFWPASKKTFEEKFLDKISDPKVKDIGDVVDEIKKTWGDWENRPKKFAKFEKARELFMQFSNKINDFKGVFDLIPSDNMYTSTLYGALTLLINASANYQAMAEGFATALDQIAFELSHAKGLHALYNTPEMTTAVINLYSHVLKFLCASMKWCMDQGPFGRFLYSFQEGGYWSKVSDILDTIKMLAQRLKDVASKAGEAEIRDINLRAREAETRNKSERALMWSAMQFLIAKQCELDFKAKSQPTYAPSLKTTECRPQIEHNIHTVQGLSDSTGSGKQKMLTTETPLSSESLFPTAHEIFSEYLEGIDVRRDLSKIKLWQSSLTKISLAPEPVRRIREWLTSADPSIIWLRGYMVQRKLVNPISTMAANIVSAVQLAHVPVLYYFCGLHICSGSSKTPTLTILTSLVLQALEWRDKFARNSNSEGIDAVFTEERLEEAIALDNIWSLFVDVIRLLPNAPVIIIDLIDTYFHYSNGVRDLIDRLATLVPGLSSEDAEVEAILGADGLSRACKILITSRTTCILLEKTILKSVKVDVRDSPRWRGLRNNELELGFTLREDVEKARSVHSLSDDSDESDGYATG